MEDLKSKKFWQHIGVATIGMLLFAMGINLFIVPADLYNGGILGISQILRTISAFVFGQDRYCGCYQSGAKCSPFYIGICIY